MFAKPSICLCGFWSCCLCVFMLLPDQTLGGDPAASAQKDHIRELVESLGSVDPGPVRKREGGAEYFAFPANFNWDAYERIRKTIKELADLGLDAFPELVAHAHDPRFCCLIDGAVVPERRSVGDISATIINRRVEVYDYDITFEDRWIPSSLPGRYFGRSEKSVAEWWEENKNKSLLEMQSLAAEFALQETKNRKTPSRPGDERLKEFEERRAGNVNHLETLISELKRTQKPIRSKGIGLRIVPRGLKDDEKRREVRAYIGK